MKDQDLIANDRPSQQTVNGQGLIAWGALAANNEVHLHRMDVKNNGVYVVHIIWLDGRRMTTMKDALLVSKPVPAVQVAQRRAEALELFR